MGHERRRAVRRAVEATAALGLAAALLGLGVPGSSGTTWTEIRGALGGVPATTFVLLTLVWLTGLWAHTIVLTAALPGLSHRRAFFLNITGSSVSNLVPLGGTLGTAVNYWSCRVWGFTTAAFIRWALVTNIWDVLGRLVVPALAVAWLGWDGLDDNAVLAGAALGSAILLLVLVTITSILLHRDVGARVLGTLADRMLRVLHRRTAESAGAHSPVLEVKAVELRRDTAELVAHAWPRLTAGKLLYAAFQGALLWLCLSATGTAPAGSVVLAAFAVERVLSLAVVTPGGAGIVEIGMTGYLTRMGVDPVTAASGVLLYRFFVIGMEVPVGGALLLPWALRHLRERRSGGWRAGGPRAGEPDLVPSVRHGTTRRVR